MSRFKECKYYGNMKKLTTILIPLAKELQTGSSNHFVLFCLYCYCIILALHFVPGKHDEYPGKMES